MDTLVPRQVEEAEAARLGIQPGWYGMKVSGTFVTGACASFDACSEAIDLLPAPANATDTGPSMKSRPATSFRRIMSVRAPTAYQIARKPGR
jgi:hypothetical protein